MGECLQHGTHGCPSIHPPSKRLGPSRARHCRKAATPAISVLSYLIHCRGTSERAPSALISPWISTLDCARTTL